MSIGGFARSKGCRAEREVCKILQPVVTKVYSQAGIVEIPQLERNLMQSMKGGYDIVGIDWLALEVKHQETFNLNQWWAQALKQAGTTKVPILLYRRNNVKWRVMMMGYLNAVSDRVRCPVDVTLDYFLLYLEARLKHSLQKES